MTFIFRRCNSYSKGDYEELVERLGKIYNMAFGVYIHIPYCVKKCPYCDFNSYGVGRLVPEDDYTLAILRELDLYRDFLKNVTVTSIFFGGGTPSLFSPSGVESIIDRIASVSSLSPDVEVSIEVNPKTANLEKLRGFLIAGVNRISVGVQSFSERKLKVLGRINSPHDSETLLKAVERAGFVNFNIDLMFGVPFETLKEWESDLRRALEFGSTHISSYCLTIEDDTEFATLYSSGKLPLPDEDMVIDMFNLTGNLLEVYGYLQYEVSNFSKPGFECRHNLIYWQGNYYLGLGAGAHSYVLDDNPPWGVRFANIRDPNRYINVVKEGKRPVDFLDVLDRKKLIEDRFLMGLRLKEGIDLRDIRERLRVYLNWERLDPLVEEGFLEVLNDSLKVTKKGVLILNELIVKVLDALVYKE
jgi:oxygen-independent coproporphyrinogen-3 oxidase